MEELLIDVLERVFRKIFFEYFNILLFWEEIFFIGFVDFFLNCVKFGGF